VETNEHDPNETEKHQRPASVWFATRQLAGIGTEIVASIIGLGLLGYGCDRFIWHNHVPSWCTVIGLLLGVVGGLYNAIKKAQRFFDEEEDDSSQDDAHT